MKITDHVQMRCKIKKITYARIHKCTSYLLSQPPQPLVLGGHLSPLVVLLPEVLEPLLLGDEHLLLRLDLRLLPVRHVLQLVGAQVRQSGIAAPWRQRRVLLLLLLLLLLMRVECASCKGRRRRRGRLCPHSIVCRNRRRMQLLLLKLQLQLPLLVQALVPLAAVRGLGRLLLLLLPGAGVLRETAVAAAGFRRKVCLVKVLRRAVLERGGPAVPVVLVLRREEKTCKKEEKTDR